MSKKVCACTASSPPQPVTWPCARPGRREASTRGLSARADGCRIFCACFLVGRQAPYLSCTRKRRWLGRGCRGGPTAADCERACRRKSRVRTNISAVRARVGWRVQKSPAPVGISSACSTAQPAADYSLLHRTLSAPPLRPACVTSGTPALPGAPQAILPRPVGPNSSAIGLWTFCASAGRGKRCVAARGWRACCRWRWRSHPRISEAAFRVQALRSPKTRPTTQVSSGCFECSPC